jgi:poly(glycerol-phosphate) alpha-glucosyltransferase
LKILHVVRGLLNSSGTTHIVGPLSEAQARLGHELSVYFVAQSGGEVVAPRADLVTTRCFPRSLSLHHPGVSLPFARALQKVVADFDFVHIHAIWNFPTLFTMLASSRVGVPYMVAPQGSLEPWVLRQHRWPKALYARFAEIPLMNRAAFMQALSQAEATQIRAAGITAPLAIVPNGVTLGTFERRAPPLTRKLNLPSGQKTLLSLSRLDPKKGVDILIRGFAKYAVARNDVTLVIAGGDAGSGYRSALESVAIAEGVAHRVVFVGEVMGDAKYDVLRGADAFALISHSEGLPVAGIEAMAAGLPVIVTPGCNLPEVSAWDAGLIVNPEPEAVAQGLVTLFADIDAARRWGDNGLRLVREKFTWDRIARQACEFYEQGIKGRPLGLEYAHVR